MSLAGFKKQINKANQFMSEKIGGAKGTELDEEFIEMERKVDVLEKLVTELMVKTQELLQPNPATRAKMAAAKSFSKIRGQTNSNLYPQPEGLLGDSMIKFGKDLGEDSLFGQALTESGESYKRLAEAKYSLEDTVKQNFLDPLHQLQDKDLREVNHHRKKLSGRRLDYDCKKRKQQKEGTPAADEEVRVAEEKFDESKQVTETALHNLLENDEEQISQLASFIDAERNYHQTSVDVLQSLLDSLKRKSNEASSRPRKEHVAKRVTSFRSSGSDQSYQSHGGADAFESFTEYKATNSVSAKNNNSNLLDFNEEPLYSTVNKSAKPANGKVQPRAEALFDFDPENPGELGFREGDIINLQHRIDENWLEGSVHGKSGFFPVTYVKIIVDLPQ